MFDADHPIKNSSEDKLNRALFAKYLARSLLDQQNVESLVVGLFGGFGTGKTSLINLVLEELTIARNNAILDSEKPIIMNFSVWSYAGQHQLVAGFFRRLAFALQKATYLENRERIVYLLESYATFFTHESMMQHSPWYTKVKSLFSKKPYAWQLGQDITHIKTELNHLLYKQNNKIVIAIDNISRLDGDEVKTLFQIVKSMANYANTSYLLTMDKKQVLHALNKGQEGFGEHLLDKIIQLPFNIPPILQHDLEMILNDRLNHAVAMVPDGRWSAEYWAMLYFHGLKYFFKHCRDITRYVNLLQFSYPHVRDVVNPMDYFALTAIEIFMPQIYQAIRENKDLFSDLFKHVYEMTDKQIENEKLRCDEIIMRNKRLPYEVTRELLILLFPRLKRIYYPELTFYHSDEITDKRQQICNPNWFDVYFRMSLQKEMMTETELMTLLGTASDDESFDQTVNRLNQDHRILNFLDLLDNMKILNQIPPEMMSVIISNLLDNGDLFPIETSDALHLETPMRIHHIIHALLQRKTKMEERYAILQTAIANAKKSIYIIIYELNQQSLQHYIDADEYRPDEFRDLNDESLKSLKGLAASRIASWAKNQSLDQHPKLIPILTAWSEWENDQACEQYVKMLTAQDKGLLYFLMAILDKPITQAMTKYVKDSEDGKYIKKIDRFLPAADLIPHAKQLFEEQSFENLTEREQLALMIFLDYMQANTKKRLPKIAE